MQGMSGNIYLYITIIGTLEDTIRIFFNYGYNFNSAMNSRTSLGWKGLRRQIGVGVLVCIQEWRALLVPLMNRLQTAGQPRVNRGSTAGFVPPPVYMGIPLFVRAQGRAEVYKACRGVGVLVCIQSASRNEERLSSTGARRNTFRV